MSLLKELLVLSEGDTERHTLARAVGRVMKVEYGATFTDAEYVTAAQWLLFSKSKVADSTTQRVIDMFKKLHSLPVDDAAARRLMYQEFVSKPGLDRLAYKLKSTDKGES